MKKTSEELMNEAIVALTNRLRRKRRRKRKPGQKPLFYEGVE